MKLTVAERLCISELFPAEGNIISMTLTKDISEKVSITQEEIKDFEIISDETGIRWNAKKQRDIDVEFTELELNLLKDQVKKFDEEKKISARLLNICLKIQRYSI